MEDTLLFVAKTTCTLYFDYEGDYWDDCNPKDLNPYYKKDDDYEVMRKGTILYFYENSKRDTDDDEYYGRAVYAVNSKGCCKMTYDELEDALEDTCLEIIDDKRK